MNPFAAVALFAVGLAIGSLAVFVISQRLLETRITQATAAASAATRASAERASELAGRLAAAEEQLRAKEREVRSLDGALSTVRTEAAQSTAAANAEAKAATAR